MPLAERGVDRGEDGCARESLPAVLLERRDVLDLADLAAAVESREPETGRPSANPAK